MQAHSRQGKLSLENLPDQPRMMGEADVQLIQTVLSKLPKDARLIEFGPWLGGVSALLAQHGELHVVDRFEWTEPNDQKFPDVLPVGGSFRPHFETLMQQQGFAPNVHETAFEDFVWTGGALDFCLLDGPRTGDDLLTCLSAVAKHLNKDALVLVKHGLNPAHIQMMAALGALVAQGVLTSFPTDQPKWCNIAVFRAGPNVRTCPDAYADVLQHPLSGESDRLDDIGLRLYLAWLVVTAAEGNLEDCFQVLRDQAPVPEALDAWDEIEPHVPLRRAREALFAVFADLFAFHHSGGAKDMWCDASQSASWALRHAWVQYVQDADANARFSVAKVMRQIGGKAQVPMGVTDDTIRGT